MSEPVLIACAPEVQLCSEGRAAAPLRGVLAHHDRLVTSHEPPSEWVTKEGE